MMPARGIIFVRPVETPETLGQGKIILTQAMREVLTTHQMEVVSVGDLGYCEDCDTCERAVHVLRENQALSSVDTVTANIFHPCEVKAGDWVLVRHRSLTETHQDNLFAVAQDDVLARLETHL